MWLVFIFYIFAQQESYKDIVSKAQRLTLLRERPKAVQMLKLVLDKKQLQPNEKQEVVAAFDRITEVFLKDRTQTLYSKAISLKSKDTVRALDALEEALSLEPYNILLHLEKAVIAVKSDGCKDDAEMAKKGLEVNPYYKEMLGIYYQAHVCLDQSLDINIDSAVSPEGIEAIYINALQSFLVKDYARALNSIDQGIKSHKYAAHLYWVKDKILQVKGLSQENNYSLWRQACKQDENPLKKYPWTIDVCSQLLKAENSN
tara:strand:- start:13187 stop:13963 length:777 start_codon:yes stop_codon:yes gene_type:complete